MRTLEKVNIIRQSINYTYEEARKALILCEGIEYIAKKYRRSINV